MTQSFVIVIMHSMCYVFLRRIWTGNFKKVKLCIFAQELCLLPILFTLLNIKELNICCTYYHLFDFCVLHKVCLIRDKTGFWPLKSFKTAILFFMSNRTSWTQWILLVILLMDWKLFCKLKVHVFICIKQMNKWCLVALINSWFVDLFECVLNILHIKIKEIKTALVFRYPFLSARGTEWPVFELKKMFF